MHTLLKIFLLKNAAKIAAKIAAEKTPENTYNNKSDKKTEHEQRNDSELSWIEKKYAALEKKVDRLLNKDKNEDDRFFTGISELTEPYIETSGSFDTENEYNAEVYEDEDDREEFFRKEWNYNTSDPEAVEIHKKIEKLIYINHDVEINDIISIEEVRRFEAENNIKLPDDYVWFITNVGNGGIWQDGAYRFYPLEDTYFSCEGLPRYECGTEKYSIDIFSMGCSSSFGIILKGEHFGEISSDDEGRAYYHLLPIHGFKEFYLKWLEEESLKYDMHSFEHRLYGTIEEHLKEYKKDPNPYLLNNILSKVNKKCASDQFVSDVYSVFESEPGNVNKVLLARILIKSGYKDTFSVLSAIFTPENYENIVRILYYFINYFKDHNYNRNSLMKDSQKYYSMLVRIMKYYETANKRKYFEECFEMTVMNPLFKANDIIGFLTSDDEEIVKYLAEDYHSQEIGDRVKKYIENAQIKYEKIKHRDTL